jgi:hypothetical protein
MHFLGLLFYSLVIANQTPAQAPADSFLDHGTLKILVGGQLLGTEHFDIEAAGEGYRMKGDLKLKMPNGADATESAVLNLNHDLIVTSYMRLQKSPKRASIQVNIAGGQATAHYSTPEGDKDFDFMLEPAMVILDTNFFHHFALFVRRYDFTKGGGQHIQVLIPQEAQPGMMLVENVGKDEGYDKLVAKTDTLEIQIWCDSNRRLVKLAVPAAKVEIVRDPKN